MANLAQRGAEQGWLKWAIAITASFAAILEVIDVSIVNVALPYMQGNLGATLSEIGWVSTGYSIANVIVIPLTAWLGERYGKKHYFVFSLIAFTLASILCGLASNLSMLIVGRVLQGLGGGGLLAKAQALMFETFPPEEQGKASTVFTMGVIAGPAIGPALGGYLTDNFGWRWIFFINVPLGILAVLAALTFLPKDDPEHKTTTDIDWWGIILLAVGLGCFQTVLEQGQQDDWFSSEFIRDMAIFSVIGLIGFIWHELHTPHPAVDLYVLRYGALAAGSVISLVVGMGLYGTIFVVPVFTQNILNFTATKTGLLLVPGAIASAAGSLTIGLLRARFGFGFRTLIILGSLMTIGVMLSLTDLNPDTGADQFFWPLIFRGFGSVMMFIPLSQATLGSLPKEEVSAGSGFFSLTRQLGGSIGIAAITTLVAKQQVLHRSQLVENISDSNPAYQERISSNLAQFSPFTGDSSLANQQALTQLDESINLQAALLSYRDVFYLVALIFIVALPLVVFLKPRPLPATSPA